MPTYGLTSKQRRREPWGLPEEILKPGKLITDPVWGDIYLTRLETAIVDSEAFQRLRRVRQLGFAHIVYPGATHSRFSHSLGALRVSQDLLDAVLQQRGALHGTPDLFGQWEENDSNAAKDAEARVVVLVRLGALLHDLGHVPFGHTVEDDLTLLAAHDANKPRFERLWKSVAGSVESAAQKWCRLGKQEAHGAVASLTSREGPLFGELKPMILSPPAARHEGRTYPFALDLVGNTICADLLDYLVRDHMNTGLPASLGSRFLTGFFVTRDDHPQYPKRAVLSVTRGGDHERADVVTELLKALRYRYELGERVLDHHAKLAADAMLGNALQLWSEALWLQEAKSLVTTTGQDYEGALGRGDIAAVHRAVEETVGTSRFAATNRAVREHAEKLFTSHSDDGVLDHLAALGDGLGDERSASSVEVAIARRMKRSASLAQMLLDRRLFRAAGRAGRHDAAATELHRAFGKPEARNELERSAARFAELTEPGKLALWLPAPTMRVKLAEVLVDHGGSIESFANYERIRGGRGTDIYTAHEQLWTMWLFVDRDLSEEQEEEIVCYLARALNVRWERYARFGPQPSEWPLRLALARTLSKEKPAGAVFPLAEEVNRGLPGMVSFANARRGPEPTFKSLLAEAQRVRDAPRA